MSVAKKQNDIAYETLKKALVTLQLAPGEFLNVAQLMAQYQMGRTPINQAIHRLAHERLVQIVPRKGIIVTPLSMDEALDLIEVRIANEVLCLRLAAQRITDDQLARLKKTQANYRKAIFEGQMGNALEADRIFHETLAEASGNRVLPDVLTRLHARAQRFWAMSLDIDGHVDRVVHEHDVIIDALERRDEQAAALAIETHISSFRDNFFNTAAGRTRRIGSEPVRSMTLET